MKLMGKRTSGQQPHQKNEIQKRQEKGRRIRRRWRIRGIERAGMKKRKRAHEKKKKSNMQKRERKRKNAWVGRWWNKNLFGLD